MHLGKYLVPFKFKNSNKLKSYLFYMCTAETTIFKMINSLKPGG